jgi:hypothetical protein
MRNTGTDIFLCLSLSFSELISFKSSLNLNLLYFDQFQASNGKLSNMLFLITTEKHNKRKI